MNPQSQRHPDSIQAIIFDWAGTLVDFGSFAPILVLIQAFAEIGIDVQLSEARMPMGLTKRDHIQALGRIPTVAERWQRRYGRPMNSADVDALYARFMPLQLEYIAPYSKVIPGVVEVIGMLRERGVGIGSTSGYPRLVMDRLEICAREQGLRLDHTVAGDDLKPGGRPGPWMALANVIELGVRSVSACVKVDDTEPGIIEGLRAGMWTVGIAMSGNEVGLSQEELQALSFEERQVLRERVSTRIRSWGAHHVIDSVADLPGVLDLIETRLAFGERP